MKIVTDSAADLAPEEVQSLGIQVAPLVINFPDGQVKSDEISPDEFYNRLKAMEPAIPTTSQPSSGMFADLYRKVAQTDSEIFSIHISSGLSGTIESARVGAQQAGEANVHLFDTLTLSGGERFHVLAAAHAVQAGWSKDAILERLERMRGEVETVYTLETLTYLARGGRIGRVQALAGSLLKIKPIIAVDKKDGKYNNEGRARTIGKALDMVVDHHLASFGKKPVWVTVLHGQYQEQADALEGLVRQRLNVARLETMRISPVLGVHTGPGVIGAAVVPIEHFEGLL